MKRTGTLIMAVAALGGTVAATTCATESVVEPNKAALDQDAEARLGLDLPPGSLSAPGTWVAVGKNGAVLASGRIRHSPGLERILREPSLAEHWQGSRRATAARAARELDPRCSVSWDASDEEFEAYNECRREAVWDPECEIVVEELFKDEQVSHIHGLTRS